MALCWHSLLPAGWSIDLVCSRRCSLALADWDKTVAKSCKSTTGSWGVFLFVSFFFFVFFFCHIQPSAQIASENAALNT